MPSPLDRSIALAFRTLNRLVIPVARAGLGSPLPLGLGVVVLESTGRVSGRPRPVPLVAARVGGKVLASTVRPDSQWVRNLEADPRSAVWLWGSRRPGVARVRRGPLSVVRVDLDEDRAPGVSASGDGPSTPADRAA